MPLLHAKTPLTQAERLAKRRLVLQDTLALLGLFAITAVLAVLTYLLFNSYSQHQKDAAARWLRRGETALHNGRPEQAIYALRSALAYTPNRNTEIELAEALAQSGHVQEATSYFNALWEAEPGNGLINLQLARLELAAHNVSKAMEYYHAAIFGTWEGDGAVRRRGVRLEMVGHLIQLGRFGEARNELLIAAGNANDTDIQDRLEIAGLLLAAHAPGDALRLYKDIAAHQPTHFAALEGAGRTAYTLGRYREAQRYLQRALAAAAADPSAENGTAIDRAELDQATRLLELYPSPNLPFAARAQRILQDRDIAEHRLQTCAGAPPPQGAPGQGAPASTPKSATSASAASPATPAAAKSAAGPAADDDSHSSGTAGGAALRIARALGLGSGGTAPAAAGQKPATPATPASSAPAASVPQTAPGTTQAGATLANVQAELAAQPRHLDAKALMDDPTLEQSILQWVYDTEQATATICGPPTGDDALLLRIAQTPDAIDQQ